VVVVSRSGSRPRPRPCTKNFERATQAKDAVKARDLAGSLMEQHGSTVYAALVALRAAKSNLDASDRKAAKPN